MSTPTLPAEEIKRREDMLETCLREGYAPLGWRGAKSKGSAVAEAVRRLGFKPGLSGTFSTHLALGVIKVDWSLYKAPQAPAPPAVVAPPPAPEATPVAPIAAPERVEITALRDKVRVLETQLREADRAHITEQQVREKILGLSSYSAAPPEWLIRQGGTSGIAGVPVTIWSDWHLGEVVSLAETNGVNEFNFSIAETRIRKLVERTLDLCFKHMTGANYPGIVINLAGDIISGALHPELAENDEDDIFPTILWAIDRLIWALDAMSQRFPHVFVPCVPGNHGRVLDKKPYNKKYVYRNADWLIYSLLERHFKAVGNDKIQFFTPATGEALYRVYDHRLMTVHGDDLGVRGGDGIIGAIGPIQRGEIKMRTSSAQIGRDYDTLLMGHWHQMLWLPRAIVNNCLKGYDEYARRSLRAVPTLPAQALFFIHPKHHITAKWEVQLEDSALPQSTNWVSWPTEGV